MILNRKANPLGGLAVLLIANVLLFWYPLYQTRNYPPSDKPDISILALLAAFALTLATLLLAPLGVIRVWFDSASLTPRARTRVRASAVLMLLFLLAPLCYWVPVFIKLRKTNGSRHFTRHRNDVPMAQMVALTVQDGVYPLGKPLAIGRLNGGALFLTVDEVQMETASQ